MDDYVDTFLTGLGTGIDLDFIPIAIITSSVSVGPIRAGAGGKVEREKVGHCKVKIKGKMVVVVVWSI